MSKLSARLGAALVAGVVTAAILPSTAAFALGNNRVVNRSCGSNYVSSGWSTSTDRAWAQTQKNSGDCSGSLGASIVLSNGVRVARVNGDRNAVYMKYDTPNRPQNGVHWGCLDCNSTLS